VVYFAARYNCCMSALPENPWFHLLHEIIKRPVFCTIWLAIIVGGAVAITYLVSGQVAVVFGSAGGLLLLANLLKRKPPSDGPTGAIEPTETADL
jgi:hypothetical protein